MLKFAIFNIPTEPWFLSPVISLLVRLSVSSSISLQFLSIDLREKIFFITTSLALKLGFNMAFFDIISAFFLNRM